MNIKSVESRFQKLEEREEKVRNYFYPANKSPNKHRYIKDLFQDYQYDRNIYGGDLSSFNQPDERDKVRDSRPASEVPHKIVTSRFATPSPEPVMLTKFKPPRNSQRKGTLSEDKWTLRSNEKLKLRNQAAREGIEFSDRQHIPQPSALMQRIDRHKQTPLDLALRFQPGKEIENVRQIVDPKPSTPTELPPIVLPKEPVMNLHRRPSKSLAVATSMPQKTLKPQLLKPSVIRKIRNVQPRKGTIESSRILSIASQAHPLEEKRFTSVSPEREPPQAMAPIRAMYKFKESLNSFRPLSYTANLVEFAVYDKIQQTYGKRTISKNEDLEPEPSPIDSHSSLVVGN